MIIGNSQAIFNFALCLCSNTNASVLSFFNQLFKLISINIGKIKNIIEYKYSFGLGIIGKKYLYKFSTIK